NTKNKMFRIPLPLFAFLLCHSLSMAAVEPKGPAGDWAGTLDLGQVKLRLLFKIRKTPEGSLIGTLDSLDQGAMDIRIDEVSFKQDKVHLEVKLIQGVYDGTLHSSGIK